MNWLETLGWVGNVCFFSRWIVQWYASERAKKSVAPISFWWVSLAGTATLGTYTLLKAEPILLVGYCVNVLIYMRNLTLARQRENVKAWRGWQLALMGTVIATALVSVKFLTTNRLVLTTPAWQAVGIIGLTTWNSRWALQWWFSEKRSKSHFPLVFWWVSLLGNSLLLAYAIHLGNPVWIAGYVLGPIIQMRNLILNRRYAKEEISNRSELQPAPKSAPAITPSETSEPADEANPLPSSTTSSSATSAR